MEKILKITIATFLILILTIPTTSIAEQTDGNDVEVNITGGLGVTIEVINNRNTSVEVNYSIIHRTGSGEGNITVPADSNGEFTVSQSPARFSFVIVTASWDDQIRIKVGVRLFIFTYLRIATTL